MQPVIFIFFTLHKAYADLSRGKQLPFWCRNFLLSMLFEPIIAFYYNNEVILKLTFDYEHITCNCNCCIQSQWASASAFQNFLGLPTIRYYLQKIWVTRHYNTRLNTWAAEWSVILPPNDFSFGPKDITGIEYKFCHGSGLALSRKAPGPPVPSPCPSGLSAYYKI